VDFWMLFHIATGELMEGLVAVGTLCAPGGCVILDDLGAEFVENLRGDKLLCQVGILDTVLIGFDLVCSGFHLTLKRVEAHDVR
jgi:hypothetical protein